MKHSRELLFAKANKAMSIKFDPKTQYFSPKKYVLGMSLVLKPTFSDANEALELSGNLQTGKNTEGIIKARILVENYDCGVDLDDEITFHTQDIFEILSF